jgi:prepilin-type N-terminal cleavage/methylation domain-containing protein
VKNNRNSIRGCAGASAGFSILELVISMSVMLVLAAIAAPNVNQTLHIYTLNSSAMKVANQLKSARFQAISRNLSTNCVVEVTTDGYRIWTDTNGNGTYDATETTTLVSPGVTLVTAGAVATSGNLAGAIGVTGVNTLSGSSSNVTIPFDSRGAVTGGALNAVNVFYVEDINRPQDGYRAVVLLPSGSIQVWQGAQNSAWTRSN